MAKIPMGRVVTHFSAERANRGAGTEAATDVRDTLEENLPTFANEVTATRRGISEDERGNRIPAYDITLEEATRLYFGADVQQFTRSLGIFSRSDTVESVARRGGGEPINRTSFANMLVEHQNYAATTTGNAPQNTGGISGDYRFIIPELIMNAIRTGYLHTAMSPNWTATNVQLSQLKATVPQILRGNSIPSRVAEGANIPFGSLAFAQKGVTVYKIGTGMSITDELLLTSTLDMFFIYMQEVGNDMSVGRDVAAIDVLLNGEQLDGSESAPVVGVNTIGTVGWPDLKRVFTRMRRIGKPATRIIAGEDDTIAVTGIDRIEGFNGDRSLANIATLVGVPDRFEMDVYPLPANQLLFLNPQRALMQLGFRGMLTERDRNPQNQTEQLFVSDYINFAVINRDARVILDKSVSYATNGFPPYMDIDGRIKTAYVQE